MLKRKPKRHKNLPSEVIAEVDRRADGTVGIGRCEECGGLPDFRGLQYAEPIKGIGGTTRVFTADEVFRKCARCHNTKDHGIKEVASEVQWSRKGE